MVQYHHGDVQEPELAGVLLLCVLMIVQLLLVSVFCFLGVVCFVSLRCRVRALDIRDSGLLWFSLVFGTYRLGLRVREMGEHRCGRTE